MSLVLIYVRGCVDSRALAQSEELNQLKILPYQESNPRFYRSASNKWATAHSICLYIYIRTCIIYRLSGSLRQFIDHSVLM